MNFFYQVRESVIDFKFYKKIKDNRFGKTFLYILLLLLIIYSMMTVRNFILVKTIVEQTTFELSENIPDFELKNGKFSFAGEMPFYISNNVNELYVIDTTGTLNPNVINNVMSGILITEDKVYLKNNIQSQSINLADFNDAYFNKQTLIEFLPKISWMVPVGMMIMFIFGLGWKLFNAVLLALIGILINSILNTDLKFKQMWNFSIYALTLPMLIKLAVDVSGYAVPMFFVVYWAISIVYIALAIKAYKESSDQEDGYSDDTGLI